MSPEDEMMKKMEGQMKRAASRAIILAALMLYAGVMLIAQGAGSDEPFAVKVLVHFLAAISFGSAVYSTVHAAMIKTALNLADAIADAIAGAIRGKR